MYIELLKRVHSWRNTQDPKSRRISTDSLVPGRLIALASTNDGYCCEIGSLRFYSLCGIGGMISCGITHTLLTPLDLVKCRIQADPKKYVGVFNGFRVTLAEDGPQALVRGWAPTFIGYSIQGFCKFGFYEFFKIFYSGIIGEENTYIYRTWLYLIASASAEVIADIGLAPMEAAKVKMQTTPGYTDRLREALPKIAEEEGLAGFYKAIVPLWMRQIPYTMMKFASFEKAVELLYHNVVPKPREECSKAEQLIVTFSAGYIAGILCAIVSHPADSVITKLNQAKGSSTLEVAKALGFADMWKGIVPRIIMIGTLTALQWFIYDAFKVANRLPRPPPPRMPESLRKKMD